MPTFVESDPNTVQEIIDSGGLDKGTLKKQENTENHFKNYLKIRGFPDLDDLIKDKSRLQVQQITK
jgi:hypothetical protein